MCYAVDTCATFHVSAPYLSLFGRHVCAALYGTDEPCLCVQGKLSSVLDEKEQLQVRCML